MRQTRGRLVIERMAQECRDALVNPVAGDLSRQGEINALVLASTDQLLGGMQSRFRFPTAHRSFDDDQSGLDGRVPHRFLNGVGFERKCFRERGSSKRSPGPAYTVVELGTYASKNDFFDMALEVIRSVEGLLTARNLPVQWNAQGSGQEQALQFLNDFFGRTLAVKQRQQLVLQGVISVGPIDLFRILFWTPLLFDGLLGWLRQQGFQIAQQYRSVKVLPDGFHSFATEIFQVEPTFEHVIKGLVIPAAVIHLQELLRRILLLIEQGGHQHLQLAIGQAQTDETHDQFQRQAPRLEGRPLIGRGIDFGHHASVPPVEPKQLLRCGKRTRRAPANHLHAVVLVLHQIHKARESAIIDHHVPRRHQRRLLNGQRNLTHFAGRQAGINTEAIEQIVEHRYSALRIGRSGSPLVVFNFHSPELLVQFRTIGQSNQRAVMPKEPMSMPTLQGLGLSRRQDHRLVQLDESGVLELGARMGPSASRDRFKELARGQLIEKLMEMALDRFDGFLQHEEHDQGKGQLPLARKIFRSHSVASDERRIAETDPQRFDKLQEISRDGRKNGSHSQFKYTMYLQCTFKNENIFISFTNSTTVLPKGEGAATACSWNSWRQEFCSPTGENSPSPFGRGEEHPTKG